jgi:hypothetical protein
MAETLWPTYTFQVNLPTLRAVDWSQPSRSTLDGNETVTEASNLPNTRTTWLPGMFPGVENIAQVVPGGLNTSTQNGAIITASGLKAIYLKKTYCSIPPDPLNDVLIQLS